MSDQLGADDELESGLPVDPDELGTRFLREATEQGYSDPTQRALDVELALSGEPGSDAALRGPNYESNNTQWEQTVDLELRHLGAAEELRAAATVTARDPDDQAEDEADLVTPLQAAPTARETKSLLDYEGESGDETYERSIDTPEDSGRHARIASASAGAEPSDTESGVHRVVVPLAVQPAADGGQEPRARKLRNGVARWVANSLHRLAHWLERIPSQLN